MLVQKNRYKKSKKQKTACYRRYRCAKAGKDRYVAAFVVCFQARQSIHDYTHTHTHTHKHTHTTHTRTTHTHTHTTHTHTHTHTEALNLARTLALDPKPGP
jgi:hypothetical protein